VDGGNPAGSATVVLPAGQIHFFMEIATTYGTAEALQELDKRCRNWSFLPDRFTFLKTQREKHCGTLRKK
jgi:hypothetical protein